MLYYVGIMIAGRYVCKKRPSTKDEAIKEPETKDLKGVIIIVMAIITDR